MWVGKEIEIVRGGGSLEGSKGRGKYRYKW